MLTEEKLRIQYDNLVEITSGEQVPFEVKQN